MAFRKGYGLHRTPLWGVIKARSFGPIFFTHHGQILNYRFLRSPTIFLLVLNCAHHAVSGEAFELPVPCVIILIACALFVTKKPDDIFQKTAAFQAFQ